MTKNKKITTAVIAVVVAIALFAAGYFISNVFFSKKTDTDAVAETTGAENETTLQDETETTVPSDTGSETDTETEEEVDEAEREKYIYLLENEKIGSGVIKVDKAEYEYYCATVYNSLLMNAFQYDAYGAGMGLQITGFDWTKLPAEQKCNEEYNGKTFDNYEEYIEYMAELQLLTIKACVEYAKLNSITLDDETLAEIDAFIEENRESCSAQGYTLEEYLKKFYGKNMTEEMYLRIAKEYYIVNKVDETKSGMLKEYFTDEMVEEEYNRDIKGYSEVTLRNYVIVADTDESGNVYDASMEAAKGEAEVFAGLLTDESSFIRCASEKERKRGNEKYAELLIEDSYTLVKNKSYYDLESEVSKELAEWAFDESRQAGDVYIVKVEGKGYGVYMMTDPLHKPATSYTYDVRHILVKFNEYQSDSDKLTKIELIDPSDYAVTVDIDVDPATVADPTLYMKAQGILETYLAGDLTEDSFAKLAMEHSADGNAVSGGLYEDVTEGYMVSRFENWALEEGREKGDVGIVETVYGYHVMYFVGKEVEYKWEDLVRDQMIYNGVYDFIDALEENYDIEVDVNRNDIRALYQVSLDFYKSYVGM